MNAGRLKPKPSYVLTMDEVTWKNASLIERAVHVARSQERIGVEEITENWGGMISLYLKACGVFSPAPWCAAFVYWCLLEAGADKSKLWKNPASTYFLWKWAKDTNRLHKVIGKNRGIGVFNGGKGGHTWFYISAEGRTIEGNTNTTGSREGIKVMGRFRPIRDITRYPRYGFITIGDDLYGRGAEGYL